MHRPHTHGAGVPAYRSPRPRLDLFPLDPLRLLPLLLLDPPDVPPLAPPFAALLVPPDDLPPAPFVPPLLLTGIWSLT